jgi:hypothetical protein
VYGLDALNHSMRRRHRPWTLHGPESPFDVAVVRFNSIVGVSFGPLSTPLRETSFGLQISNRCGIYSALVLSEDDMSRSLEATSGRASGITSVLLQFRQTPSRAEIRAGDSDAGHASGIERKAANVTGEIFCSGISSLAICQIVLMFVCSAPSFSVENAAQRAT